MKALKENLSRIFGIASLLVVFGWVFSFFQEGSQASFAEFCLYLTYVLIILLVLGCLGLAITHLARNKKKLIKTVFIYGTTTLLFIISWLISTDDISTMNPSLSYSSSSLQFVGGIVTATWVLLIIAGVVSLISEVIKGLKNG